jgi:hypothetical protein
MATQKVEENSVLYVVIQLLSRNFLKLFTRNSIEYLLYIHNIAKYISSDTSTRYFASGFSHENNKKHLALFPD